MQKPKKKKTGWQLSRKLIICRNRLTSQVNRAIQARADGGLE